MTGHEMFVPSPLVSGESLLRLKDVQDITKLASSTIYRKMDDGSFPKPLKLGELCVRWKRSEIEAWINTLTRI